MSAYFNAILASAPLAFYKLQDLNAVATDQTAFARHGTYIGSITHDVSSVLVNGEVGAAKFSVPSTRITLPISTSYNKFSVEAVIKIMGVPATGSLGTIVAHRLYFASALTDFPFSLFISSLGFITAAFDAGNDFSTDVTLKSVAAYSVGDTLHIAVSRTAQGICKLFIGGVLVASAGLSATLAPYTGAWTIGGAGESGGGIGLNTFNGLITCVSIYDVALSDATVAAHADLAVGVSTISGAITDSIPAELFDIYAVDMNSKLLIASALGCTTNYSFTIRKNQGIYFYVYAIPYQGKPWTPAYSYAVGDWVFPMDPMALPYYFQRIVSGTSGGSEPIWVTDGAAISDGAVSACWQVVSRMALPKISGPFKAPA